jgi:hypothetical protein
VVTESGCENLTPAAMAHELKPRWRLARHRGSFLEGPTGWARARQEAVLLRLLEPERLVGGDTQRLGEPDDEAGMEPEAADLVVETRACVISTMAPGFAWLCPRRFRRSTGRMSRRRRSRSRVSVAPRSGA